jgi:hypothetical protein
MVQTFSRHVISPFTSSCFFRHPSDNIKLPELLRLLQKYQTQGVCPWCQQTKEMEAGNVNRRWCGKFWWLAGIQYLNSMHDVWRLPVSVRVKLGYMRDICVFVNRDVLYNLWGRERIFDPIIKQIPMMRKRCVFSLDRAFRGLWTTY